MRPFNCEIFDRNFNLVQHYNVADISYSFDYLSTVENSVVVAYDENVDPGQYVHITNNEDGDYFGRITGVSVDNVANGLSEIRYKPFISLFDAPIMFDTDLQTAAGGTGSLEQAIADIITAYWIENTDDVQNVPGLSVLVTSETFDWGFHITSDVEGLHQAIVNFETAIIRRALTKYRISLKTEINLNDKTIVVTVGSQAVADFVIEVDLPSVIKKRVLINETNVDTNKLYLYDNSDLTTNVVYYKHTDGTISTTDNDRIVPVIFEMKSVTYNQEETTFAAAAKQAADKFFDVDSYNNLIEITVMRGNDVVRPAALQIGQQVTVIANGYSYQSIYTGYEIKDTVKLIFGTIRIELTKRLGRLTA